MEEISVTIMLQEEEEEGGHIHNNPISSTVQRLSLEEEGQVVMVETQ